MGGGVRGPAGDPPSGRRLARKRVDVTLIDRRNHHLFQPLLYQVATGLLPPGQIAPPLRHIVRKHKNVRVELAEVTGFDLDTPGGARQCARPGDAARYPTTA